MAKAKTTIKKITQNAWECTKIFKTGEIEKRIVKDPIDIWSIGNTGVRNPWRIPGGYKVYVESNQVGKIRTAQEQKLFKESFNRFLIISLDVLICRYSPLLRAFPALFISEEPHKSFYYPSCFRSQK